MITKSNVTTSGLEIATDSLDQIIRVPVAAGATLAVGTPILRDYTTLPGGLLPADVLGSKIFYNAREGDRGLLATASNAGDAIGVFQGVDGQPVPYTNTKSSTVYYPAFCRKIGMGRVLAGAVASGTAVTVGSLVIVSNANIFATVGSRVIGTFIARVSAYPINTKVAAAVSSTGSQAVTPTSMAGITTSTQLIIDGGNTLEIVTPTAITATTFTANFQQTHGANFTVQGINNTPGATIIPVPGSGTSSALVLADINVTV